MSLSCRIISLHHDSAAVQALLAALAAQGIQAELFMAVDGRQGCPVLEAGEQIDDASSLHYRQATLTGSEIGCYLSHYRAVKQAYADGAEYLCLLEDDVALEEGFGDVLRALTALDQQHEFIRLMGLKIHRRKLLQDLPHARKLVRPLKGLCGTQGYLLNRSGMKKVIESGMPIYQPIDKFYDHFWEIDLQAFAVEPHIIWERAESRINSSVAKSPSKPGRGEIGLTLKKQLIKVRRSIHRKLYLWRRWSQFSGAQKPRAAQGRTARIH